MRRERADAYLKIYEKFRDNGAGHRGDAGIYEYRAMGCLTNARNQKILTVVFSMNGAHFALYAGFFAKGCGQSSMLSGTIASMNRRSYPSTWSYHAS